jgi:hypothetical protein
LDDSPRRRSWRGGAGDAAWIGTKDVLNGFLVLEAEQIEIEGAVRRPQSRLGEFETIEHVAEQLDVVSVIESAKHLSVLGSCASLAQDRVQCFDELDIRHRSRTSFQQQVHDRSHELGWRRRQWIAFRIELESAAIAYEYQGDELAGPNVGPIRCR